MRRQSQPAGSCSVPMPNTSAVHADHAPAAASFSASAEEPADTFNPSADHVQTAADAISSAAGDDAHPTGSVPQASKEGQMCTASAGAHAASLANTSAGNGQYEQLALDQTHLLGEGQEQSATVCSSRPRFVSDAAQYLTGMRKLLEESLSALSRVEVHSSGS